jgi:polyhydroxybutyrate depolymerase
MKGIMKTLITTLGVFLFLSPFYLFAQDSLLVDSLKREYLLHVPASYDGNDSVPLIIALHNAYGNAAGFESMTDLSIKSDSEGFIVAYPNGTGNPRMWNAGNCCGAAMTDSINDVGFISLLIDTLSKKYNIDASRIYATGFSNGSVLAYRLAAELSDKISGIACMSGQMMLDECNPDNPVSIIHFHALDDYSVPYEGGSGSGYEWPSVESIIDLWAGLNECSNTPDTIFDQAGVVGKRWEGADANIIVYTFPKGGHAWVESPISATDLLWEFFSTGNAVPPDMPASLNDRFNNHDYQNDFVVKYPAPFGGNNTIIITSNINENLKVMIFDIYGRLIKNEETSGKGDHNINISDNSGFSHGTYLIKIISDKTNITKKIIK